MAYFRVHAGSEERALHVNYPTMNWILRFGLLVVVQCVSLWALSQSTFQKLLPDLDPLWGHYAVRSSTGGLVFASVAWDQFGASGADIALLSLNDNGDTLWTKVYGRSFGDACYSLIATADGGYLITGDTKTTAETESPGHIYLIKTDAVGDTIWTRAYGSSAYNIGRYAVECGDGGFLVVGSSVNSGLYNSGLYMLRISSQGEIVWTRYYDHLWGPDYESTVSVRCVTETSNGDVVVTGAGAALGRPFVARLNSGGALLWVRAISSDPFLERLEATADGGVVISGDYYSNPLLFKLDSLGHSLWSKAYDGPAYAGVTDLTRTSDNGFAIIGQTVWEPPVLSDVYFLKTDSVGEVQFSTTFGDTAWHAGRSIAQSADGGYFLVAFRSSDEDYTAMCVIKTDSFGNGDCFQHNDTTVVLNVQLAWDTMELQLYPSDTERYPSACSIRSGTTVLDLCSVGVSEASPPPIAMNVFPNPTHGRFTVSIAPDYAGSEVGIFDAIGERVYSERVVQPESLIDLTSFPRGIYLVKVSSGRSAVVEKVVLE